MKDFSLKLHTQGKFCLKIKPALEHFNNWECLGTKEFLERKCALIMYRCQKIWDLTVEVKWFHYFLQVHALNELSIRRADHRCPLEKQKTGRNPWKETISKVLLIDSWWLQVSPLVERSKHSCF